MSDALGTSPLLEQASEETTTVSVAHLNVELGSACDVLREDENRTRTRHRGELISAVSNLSIQYNLGVIAPALLLLDPSRASGGPYTQSDALYPRSDETDSLLKGAVFVGAIFGQCTMGFFGESIGSLGIAMVLTNCLAFLGTIGCAFAPLIGGEKTEMVYVMLAISRAILGYGVGGKYPLASAIAADAAEVALPSSDDTPATHRARDVARGFFWQTPGAILPYVVSIALLLAFGHEKGKGQRLVTIRNYSILVGLGAIPSFVVLLTTWQQLKLDRVERASRRRGRNPQASIMTAIRNRSHWSKLVGCGLSWSLFDFVYYGTAFNQPEILARVWGEGGGLLSRSCRDLVVASMGLPGVICAINMIEPMGGPKPLQGWGFVSIAVASALLSIFFESEDTTGTSIKKWGGFFACCCLIFTLNWGCNVTTYIMPMEMFPKDCRASFHGLAAGMGKLGALAGSLAFTQLNEISVGLTFVVCVVSCMIGLLVTWMYIDPPRRETFFVGKEDLCRHDKSS